MNFLEKVPEDLYEKKIVLYLHEEHFLMGNRKGFEIPRMDSKKLMGSGSQK